MNIKDSKMDQKACEHAADIVAQMPRVMIAGAASGSGKTVITSGLLCLLKDKGLSPVSFKCGPDYIDPMFHKKVLGIDSLNLDTFLAGEDGVRSLVYDKAAEGGHFAVIEGVMGIYDGISPGSVKGSCYEIAMLTDTPVILAINAIGAGRTVISLIKGILADDFGCLIRGIILNQMSNAYYEKLLPVIKAEISKDRPDVTFFGHIPKTDDIGIGSRHLGLKLPGEIADINEKISRYAKIMEQGCDFSRVVSLMNSAARMSERSVKNPVKAGRRQNNSGHAQPLTLAVARDEAFCFYYPQNLTFLKDLGMNIVYFSPLNDEAVPEGADALLLGGGYPELFLEKLSRNVSMLGSVRHAVRSGMPVIAECGGFMYLHDSITDKAGIEYDMAGVVKGTCRYAGHLVNFGYMMITGPNGSLGQRTFPGAAEHFTGMRGHEFHYYESSAAADDFQLCKPSTGKEYTGMILKDNCLFGWPHLYYPSKPDAIPAFLGHAAADDFLTKEMKS